ncbi:MAG: FkbM family methyltransferase [Chthoniobacterales bacterium]
MLPALCYDFNHAPIWQRRLRVWDQELRAASADRLLFLALHRLGWMGAEEAALFRRLVQPGMRIVDIGANIGLYSLLLARLTSANGRVYSFEPETNLCATLRENCAANRADNVTIFQAAAGAKAGRMLLQRSPFNSGNNSLGQNQAGADALEVEIVTVDSVLPERVVDFVKIDVQGHELAALSGMDETLAASPRARIFFEFWPAGLRAAGASAEALLELLRTRGFEIYRPAKNAFQPLPDAQPLVRQLGRNGYTNLLAARPGVLDEN